MSLHVEVTGSGPDLALIHGWGMHGGIWDGVSAELARQFQVHALDLPGYGTSAACQPCDLATLAQMVAEALPTVTHVIGWSLGGLVAQRWALDHPRQVRRLMLVGSSPCFVQRSDWANGIDPVILQTFAQDLDSDYAGTLLRFLSLQARNGESLRTVMKYLRAALFAKGRPSAEVLKAGLNVLLDTDLRGEVENLTMPLAILHGERDMLAPVAAAQWIKTQVDGARLEVIPGCAHAPFLSHPETFLRVAKEFFQ
ncbi:MAG: pimeloyl-ACP methyl ester esterase BioH [Sulfurimicrobium sp.]|nr:pimeloyl-ACP methyl ester esterase BioH [Sulfurimicrobium sp.]MDZ7656402.1 pimeloyl-ACP methyl ester esterase BioH [Sulfurimicrobium sp.]